MPSLFPLRSARRVLKNGVTLYQKKGHLLSEHERHRFEELLQRLDDAVLQKSKKEAHQLSKELDLFIKAHFKKTLFDHAKELVFALLFAIVIAFTIRQVWFELYEVPTGSMRPTIEELDRLVVSKTTFGINLPFQQDLILFSPDYIKRGGIIVFTVAGMDVSDADTVYFYFFPGKKRYIKRCLGKPGDTVYFYGGLIYGIDKDGHPFKELADPAFLKENGLERIDHVPYITFEGKTILSSPLAHGIYGGATFLQMNKPVGKLHLQKDGTLTGQFFNGKEWIKDRPSALKTPHATPQSFSDLWGIEHYAMARLLTPEEVKTLYQESTEPALLYLELHHTPNLAYPQPEMRRGETGRIQPMLSSFVTLIPLQMQHLKAIQDALYTSRFFVKDGHAYRYHEGNARPQRAEFDPLMPHIPNGCYEFYYGKGYKVHWGGILTALPKNHPLYATTPENIQKLFNQGIGFNLVYEPIAPHQTFLPQRFAYFREGSLYVMGSPILNKEDPTLQTYIQKELEKQNESSQEQPYIAFIDRGPPLLENGDTDVDFIRSFGLKIPEDGVLALGDNYAMSADSRDFGFAPVMNLRGAPSFTFWPVGKRMGALPQPPYPWFTLPNCLVWGSVLIIVVICYFYARARNKKPLFQKQEPKKKG